MCSQFAKWDPISVVSQCINRDRAHKPLQYCVNFFVFKNNWVVNLSSLITEIEGEIEILLSLISGFKCLFIYLLVYPDALNACSIYLNHCKLLASDASGDWSFCKNIHLYGSVCGRVSLSQVQNIAKPDIGFRRFQNHCLQAHIKIPATIGKFKRIYREDFSRCFEFITVC